MQLHILPDQADLHGVVLVADIVLDFPGTACNVSGWQLAMIRVADSLNMLDKDALNKANE